MARTISMKEKEEIDELLKILRSLDSYNLQILRSAVNIVTEEGFIEDFRGLSKQGQKLILQTMDAAVNYFTKRE